MHTETIATIEGRKEKGLESGAKCNGVFRGAKKNDDVPERMMQAGGGSDSVRASELCAEILPAYPDEMEGSSQKTRSELA